MRRQLIAPGRCARSQYVRAPAKDHGFVFTRYALDLRTPEERSKETMSTPKSTAASVLSRRALLVNGAAMAAVAALPNKAKATEKEEAMTQASATQQSATQAGDKTAIRPFPVPTISDADLA